MLSTTKLPFYLKFFVILATIIAVFFVAKIGESLLVPFVFALICTMLLLPLARFLENKVHFPRSLACMFSLLIFVGVLVGIFSLLGSQISKLSDDWPAFKQQILVATDSLQEWLKNRFDLRYQDQIKYINDAASGSLSTGTSLIGKTLLSVSSIFIHIVFAFIYTFFMLYYRTHITIFFGRLFKPEAKQKVQEVFHQVEYIVKRYIIGIFIQMTIVTILTGIVLTILNVKYSFMLALITGIFNVLPYIGIFTALFLSVLVTFATAGFTKVLLVAGCIILIHMIDSNYIMPKVVGSKVQINSFVALMGLVIGEMVWGIPGMLLAIPIIAIIKIIFDRVEELQNWGYFLGEEEEESAKPKRLSLKKMKLKPVQPKEKE